MNNTLYINMISWCVSFLFFHSVIRVKKCYEVCYDCAMFQLELNTRAICMKQRCLLLSSLFKKFSIISPLPSYRSSCIILKQFAWKSPSSVRVYRIQYVLNKKNQVLLCSCNTQCRITPHTVPVIGLKEIIIHFSSMEFIWTSVDLVASCCLSCPLLVSWYMNTLFGICHITLRS